MFDFLRMFYNNSSDSEDNDEVLTPWTNEDHYIKYLDNRLESCRNIDSIIQEPGEKEDRTVMQIAIIFGYEKIVKYCMNRGARIEHEFPLYDDDAYDYLDDDFQHLYWNSLEAAILLCTPPYRERFTDEYLNRRLRIFEMLLVRCAESYVRYGLHPIHIECAFGVWSAVKKIVHVQPEIINKTISEKSRLWPGMTPLLIAAKFNCREVALRLIDLGASPKARDSDRNTPLHYISSYSNYATGEFDLVYNEKWFIFDEEDTFGGFFSGLSHFHIACRMCPDNLHVVEKYLKQGVCPNLLVRKNGNFDANGYPEGHSPLHIAARLDVDAGDNHTCVALIRLLLEYGAEVDLKTIKGETALEICKYKSRFARDIADTFCTLIEAGANSDRIEFEKIVHLMRDTECLTLKLTYLRCVKKLQILNPNLVSEKLKKFYDDLLNISDDFDEFSYGNDCLEELHKLTEVGLLRVLNMNEVKNDYKQKFDDYVCSPDLLKLYPIYGHMLKIKLRRYLITLEKRKEMIKKATPHITLLFKKFCNLPVTCAVNILEHFSIDEVQNFITMFQSVSEKVSKK